MSKYRWHEQGFITEVAAHRGALLEGGAGSRWRLRGGPPGLSWSVTLTPASGEDPAEIRWRCADLRADADDATRQLVVSRAVEESAAGLGDVEGGAVGFLLAGAFMAWSGFRNRRAGGRTAAAPAGAIPPGVLGPDWTVRDPRGVLDPGLAPWFNRWPTAWWGPGDERPARLGSVWLHQDGLDLRAQGWWCSAPALDQLIGLGVEIAGRLRRAGC
ncbi:hypothetical protein MRQ36_05675 [Micromonospora sp. R77]|uniref:hypothetical protein n=1 Tax=Micromonospora sp. R77 TaxID=2925836 RepID=UPI001F6022F9|nr:hypothetical protein [Micromonospora sp. R77]MCI4062081.1 hypothetical protein [Micromonospora sp. R77]